MSQRNSDVYRAFLSVLLVRGEALDLEEVFARITPQMFVGKRREIFELCRNCWKKHGTVDLTLLSHPQELEEELMKIMNGFSTSANFYSYIEEISVLYQKSRTLKVLSNIEMLTYESCNNFLRSKAEELEKLIHCDEEIKYILEGEEIREKTLGEIFSSRDAIDYSTGFSKLDEMLLLSPGDLWIVGGRPAMGKTAFLLALALNYAKQGKRVAIFSLEMSGISLMMRLYSSITGVSLSKIMNPKLRKELTLEERERIETLSKNPLLENIIIYDEPGCSKESVKFHIRQFVKKKKVEVILVDYLQYIANDGDFQRNDLKIADTTRELKTIFRKTGVLGVVLAQLNRKPEERADRRPTMGDLDGSSEIEKTADSITLLYRESYYKTLCEDNSIEIILAKQRNGATGTVKLKFLGDIQRIC